MKAMEVVNFSRGRLG